MRFDSRTTLEAETLTDILRWRAANHGDAPAFTQLSDGEDELHRLTYAELDRQCRRVAARLQRLDIGTKPVLLVFPPGRDFLVGYLGCLYAGATAVPIYPPDPRRLNRTLPRFQAIAADCGASIALSQEKGLEMAAGIAKVAPSLATIRWVGSDTIPEGEEDEWIPVKQTGRDVAFLQYTSGSTGTPKGVIVSHGALLDNFASITEAFGARFGETTVSWLPNYHDMGLIDGLLRPFFFGGHSVIMSPIDFLKKPLRWLKAVTKYRAVATGGPNFSFDLCLRKINEADRVTLDLSSLRVIYNGAEPVRPDTISRFSEVFGPCGLSPTAMLPCYGLAEATLFVAGGDGDTPPTEAVLDREALAEGRVVSVPREHPNAQVMVGVGPRRVERLLIVDPETRLALPPGRIGEIWVSGHSLASGYWRRPEATKITFEARLADTGEGPFLRTGDLGFLREDDGEVFITGRHKDMIIVRGRNHYPQDIERTVEDCHAALFRPGCGAAFSVEVDGQEQVVVVQELQRRHGVADPKWLERRVPDPRVEAFAPVLDAAPNKDEVIADIRRAVVERHGVPLHAVLLIKAGSIQKTSSGKIQRHACRRAFLKDKLDTIQEWRREDKTERLPRGDSGLTSDALRTRVCSLIAARVDIPPADLDEQLPFASMGLDSKDSVEVVGELEELLQRSLEVTVLYDYPSVSQLVAYLSGEAAQTATDPTPSQVAGEDPIAIIGIGCRFPGAEGPEAFWRLLRTGVDATREVPPDRWDAEALFDADQRAPGKTVTKRGGFVDGVADFDALFFGVAPREAAHMDPQQRMMLEAAWQALENAGFTRQGVAGSNTGVFVGVSNNDYARHIFADREAINAHFATGTAPSIVANRISYLLDMRGPSMAVDTACSSSLVAVDAAIQAIRSGACSMAVAGGVNAILKPDITVNFSKAGVMAPDGRCKAFDARANGYARGEGAGAVVLKPLSRARADGDPVYAVIRGTAVNSDGRSNGLMAPNRSAQEAVIRSAFQRSGVDPTMVRYVEAHGTGTELGDPIEVGALAAVVGPGRDPSRPCAIGSVKTNIGHLESAAGVAGLIKVALSIFHGELPPSLHFQTPNPHIPFDRLPVKVQVALEAWGLPSEERLAGVSAFGFGGTNAHVVVSGVPAPQSGGAGEPGYLLGLSAPSAAGLTKLAEDYADLLDAPGDGRSIGDVVAAAATTRTPGDERLTCVATDAVTMAEALRASARGEPAAWVKVNTQRDADEGGVVFVVPGQGPQWWAMGRELLELEPDFKAMMERIDGLLEPMAGWSLMQELGRDALSSKVDETWLTQPALFAVAMSLAEVWRSRGVEPRAVVGHSMGEVAAACLAGALSLEEGVRIIVHRGRLMQRVSGVGAMAAVELPLAQANALIRDREGQLSVAANNGPSACVISGDPEAIAEVVASLEARGVFARILNIDLAAHSPHMDALLEPFGEAVSTIAPRPPGVPLVSSLSGHFLNDAVHSPRYWVENLRKPVLFDAAVGTLLDEGLDVFVELSPHPVLLEPIAEAARARGTEVQVLPSLHRNRGEVTTLLDSMGALWTRGDLISPWKGVVSPAHGVPLPATPLQRKRYWLDVRPALDTSTAPANVGTHPLLHHHTELPTQPDMHIWETALSVGTVPFIDDHRVQGVVVLPATAYLEMAGAAAADSLDTDHVALLDVHFLRAMVLNQDEVRRVNLVITRDEDSSERWRFQVHSRAASGQSPWTLHAEGQIEQAPPPEEQERGALDRIRQSLPLVVDATTHYSDYDARGIQYGPRFQGVLRAWRREGEAMGEVELPASLADQTSRFRAHPALLDACLQVMAESLPSGASDVKETFLPVGLERLAIFGTPRTRLWSHAVARPRSSEDTYTADIRLFDDDRRLWGAALGLTVQRLDPAHSHGLTSRDWFYRVAWRDAPRTVSASWHPDNDGWLLVGHGAPWQREAAALASRVGLKVVEASVGAPVDGRPIDLTADPTEPDAFETLLEQAASRIGEAPSRIVFMAGGQDVIPDDDLNPMEAQAVTGAALLRLAQAVAGNSEARPPAPLLWVMTRSSRPEHGMAPWRDPSSAPLWGLARSLPLELPEIWGGLLDLAHASKVELELAIYEIANPNGDDQLAWNAQRRMSARLERMSPPPSGSVPAIAPEKTYLITGGLGAIGLRLAAWLAQRGARNLVLTSRRQTPDPELWGDLRERGESPWSELARLRDGGVDVQVRTCDAADTQATVALIAEISQGTAPLAGVFHAAGTVTPKPAIDLTVNDLEAVERAKIAGGWNLHLATRRLPLDHFVLFSSGSAAWGSKLLAHYGAANAFLDVLSGHRRRQGLTALSVAWGMWGEGGMSRADDNAALLQRLGIRPIAPDVGLDVLGMLMAAEADNAVVADVDWAILKSLYARHPRHTILSALATTDAPTGGSVMGEDNEASQLLEAVKGAPDADARRGLIEDVVAREASKVLGVSSDRLRRDVSLTDQGMDSLAGGELRAWIERTLGVSVNVLDILRGRGVRVLAASLADQLETSAEAGEAEPGAAGATVDTPASPEEESLPDALCAQVRALAEPREPTNILLTGATGFLGSFLLAELARRGGARLHCLVRAEDDQAATQRVRRTLRGYGISVPDFEERVVVMAGDLALPWLGLSERRWQRLTEDIDSVHHVGYLVNFLFGYQDLRATNVGGTLELLKLACAGRPKQLHFVSSFSVFYTAEHTGRLVHDDDPLYAGAGAYRETKRACEALIAQVRDRGAHVNVYRPPFISWHTETGAANARDFLIKLIRGCLDLGLAPDVALVFHLAPVDFVVRALADLASNPAASGRGFNIIGDGRGTRWVDLVSLIQRAGGELELVPYAEWRGALRSAGAANPLSVFFPNFGDDFEDRGAAVMDLFHERSMPARFDTSILDGMLPPETRCPEVDVKLVNSLLTYLKKV